jgi:hypothetical protein
MRNDDVLFDEESKRIYLLSIINIAKVDGYHAKELEYIETQALLLGVSTAQLTEYINHPPEIRTLALSDLTYELKLMLVRDVLTITALDGVLSEKETNMTEELYLALDLSGQDIASIQSWLQRYWSLLIRGVKVSEQPLSKSPQGDKEPSGQENISKADYLRALVKLKEKDKVGVVGEFLSTATAASAGALSAGAVATFAGASTILGSSSLGTLLGGFFVASTPIGWVVGCAAGAGALGLGISKLCSSGGRADEKREKFAADINVKLKQDIHSVSDVHDQNMQMFLNYLEMAVVDDKITVANAQRIEGLVLKGCMSVEVAIKRLAQLTQTVEEITTR